MQHLQRRAGGGIPGHTHGKVRGSDVHQESGGSGGFQRTVWR